MILFSFVTAKFRNGFIVHSMVVCVLFGQYKTNHENGNFFFFFFSFFFFFLFFFSRFVLFFSLVCLVMLYLVLKCMRCPCKRSSGRFWPVRHILTTEEKCDLLGYIVELHSTYFEKEDCDDREIVELRGFFEDILQRFISEREGGVRDPSDAVQPKVCALDVAVCYLISGKFVSREALRVPCLIRALFMRGSGLTMKIVKRHELFVLETLKWELYRSWDRSAHASQNVMGEEVVEGVVEDVAEIRDVDL